MINKQKVDGKYFKNNGNNSSLSLRWIISLILTNFLIFSLSYNKEASSENRPTLIPSGYRRLILPAKIFIPLNKGSSQAISLYSPKRKLLIEKAFIKEAKVRSHPRTGIAHYEIDIPDKQMENLLPFIDSYFLIYPFKALNERGQYEVVF